MRNSLLFAAGTALALNCNGSPCAKQRETVGQPQLTSAESTAPLSPELEKVKQEALIKAAKISGEVQAASQEIETQIRKDFSGRCTEILFLVERGTIDQRDLKPISQLKTKIGQMSVANVTELTCEDKKAEDGTEFCNKVFRNYEPTGETNSGFQVRTLCTKIQLPEEMKDGLGVQSRLDLSSAFGIKATIRVETK